MNKNDLLNLTEAYNQVFLKENGMEDLAKQDSREGFAPHEQDAFENEQDVVNSENGDDTEKYEAAEKLAHEIMAEHPILNDDSLEDNGDIEKAIQDILDFAKNRINDLSNDITNKGDLAANNQENGFATESAILEAKKKVNPWAVCGKITSKKKKESCVMDVKKSAKKYGKKITSKAVKKK